jgi:hypothetical protein
MGPALRSQISDPILAHGVHCALPPWGSIPGSRVRPPFSSRGSAGPTSPHGPSHRTNSIQRSSRGSEPRTNVTTTKSRGLRFGGDAAWHCFSATHAKAARAVGIDEIGRRSPAVQDEQHDDGLRGAFVAQIGWRVHVREQTCDIQRFLHHIHFFTLTSPKERYGMSVSKARDPGAGGVNYPLRWQYTPRSLLSACWYMYASLQPRHLNSPPSVCSFF